MHDVLTGVIDTAAELATEPLAWLVAGVIVLAVVMSQSREAPPSPDRRAPARVFTAQQKRLGHERAGSRCEMEMFYGVRCRGGATAADHWFPYSKGGSTNMLNFVSACTMHNLMKSNHLPTRGATARLERRRRRYFPPGTPTTAGQWL